MREVRPGLKARRLVAGLCVAAVGACAAAGAPAHAAPNNNNSQKLREAVTLEGIQQHLEAFQAIADLAGGNRFAGLIGHDRSAQYVYDRLRDAGYEPWFHEFEYDAFFEREPSRLRRLSPDPATFVNGVDFRIMSYSGSGAADAPLALPSGNRNGCAAGDFAGMPAGSIALVERGACTFRLKTTNAANAGAAAILIFNNIDGGLNGTLGADGGLSSIPSLGLTRALGLELVEQMAAGAVTMSVFTNTDTDTLTTRNVLAETAGGDPSNVVMVGGHLDSVTAGPGINDNGSGSAAILEIAEQMRKVEPRNKVRFAWWSAEESGLIGARRYVQSLSEQEGDAIALYLNFDMIGSPNFARFVYDGDNSTGQGSAGPEGSDVIEEVFYGYFGSQGLAAEPTPFNGRSDYGPFIEVGIPAGGLFTGAEGIKTAAQAELYGGTAGLAYDPCYHAACDDIDNTSAQALSEMSDAIAHAAITFGQNTELVNGVAGKGNFKRPPMGSDDGSGTGGGGGLHDHEHDGEES